VRNIKTIFLKEWHRVIRDKRLVLSVMVLPGLMIFLIYTFIGSAMTNLYESEQPRIAVVHEPISFRSLYETNELANYDARILAATESEIASYTEAIENGEWDVLIVFPEQFESLIGTNPRPEVLLVRNPNDPVSDTIANRFARYLSTYLAALSFELYGDTNAFHLTLGGPDIDPTVQSGLMLSMLLPMLVVMFMFSGAMSIGPESIAGEKERGTIATLLVTPVKRREIALGKVLSLGVLSLLSAASSFVGIALSFPKLFPEGSVTLEAYGLEAAFQTLLLMFSTVFLIVGVISVISAYAKNLKEAGTLITPVYLLTILTGVSSMFTSGANPHLAFYLIPIYNTVQSLTAVLTFQPFVWGAILVTVISNAIYVALLVLLLNRMFESERIMFAK
jgi:sodium transport system permease protein